MSSHIHHPQHTFSASQQPSQSHHLPSVKSSFSLLHHPNDTNTHNNTTRKPFLTTPSPKRRAAQVKGAPRLGTILDSGSDLDVFTQVENPQPCNMSITGANSTNSYNTCGTIGDITNVIQNPDTPANIVSLSNALTNGIYDMFCFQRHKHNHNRHDVWGLCFSKRTRTLIAFRNPDKNPFYTLTTNGLLFKQDPNHICLHIGGSNDIHEPIPLDSQLRRLCLPSPTTVTRIHSHKSIKGISLDLDGLKRYTSLSNESRLKGSMTAPIYRSVKDHTPSAPNFLDALYGDSKELLHKGPNGEKYIFTIVDKATKYPWSFPHKSFTDLPRLLERQIIQILDFARFAVGIEDPLIKRFYLDGHPTQKALTTTCVTEIQSMLYHHKIYTPPTSPGNHKEMGIVERMHRQIDKNAKTIFHECGRGLPESCYIHAYEHASKVQRTLLNRNNMASSFELVFGREPDINIDVPYPTLFSTGYAKDLDAVGKASKQGFDHIGVIVDTGNNSVRGQQLMRLYIPKTGTYLWRICTINEAFSTFPPNRIELMKSGELVHSLTSPTITTNNGRANTRSHVQQLAQIAHTTTPVPGRPGQFYKRATQFSKDTPTPFGCITDGCGRHFKTLRGLKSHMTSEAKQIASQISTTTPTSTGITEEPNTNITTPHQLPVIPEETSVTLATVSSKQFDDADSKLLAINNILEQLLQTPPTNISPIPEETYFNTNSATSPIPEEPSMINTNNNTQYTTDTPVPEEPLEALIPEEAPLTTTEPSYNNICYYNSNNIWNDTSATTLTTHKTRYQKHHFTSPNNSRGRSIHRTKNRRTPDTSPSRIPHKQNIKPPNTNRRIGAEFCKSYCLMAMNRWKDAERDERPWKSRAKLAAAHRYRKSKRLTYMNNDLQSNENNTHSADLHDGHYTLINTPNKTLEQYAFEQEVQKRYHNLPITQDPTPQYSPFSDGTTVRSMFNISDKDTADDMDDPLLLDTLRMAQIPGVDDVLDKVQGFTFINHMKTPITKDSLSIITQENASRFTPNSIRQLGHNRFRKYWYDAMDVELKTLNKYNAFEFVKVEGKIKRVNLMWIYKIKFRDGKLHKFKARLVARGFTQRAHIDFDPSQISSPVARNSSFMANLAEGVHKHHHFFEFDVKCAYLLSKLKENVYCAIPYGMELLPGTNNLILRRSLYGLKQSGFNWFTKFSKVLRQLGFRQSTVDPCLFTYEKDGNLIRICIWVDDGLVSTNNINLWKDIRDKINKATPLGSDGPIGFLLGMHIQYDRRRGIMRLDQSAKIEALLEKFGMLNCKPEPTPIYHTEKLENNGPKTLEEKLLVVKGANRKDSLKSGGKQNYKTYEQVVTTFRQIIGTCGHLSCWGRPDLRQATFLMARFQANPSLRHFRILKRILRYLKGTQYLTLTFGQRHFDDTSPLICMVDANYVGDRDSCYSTTGYVYWFYGSPILTCSCKQTAVSTSTTEAELIAASMATKTGAYLRRLLEHDFGFNGLSEANGSVPIILPDTISQGQKNGHPIKNSKLLPTPIGEDNQGTIAVSQGGGKHRKLRHIRVADSYIYQGIQQGKFTMHYVRSKDNVADIFTKCADPITFRRLRWILMGDAPDDTDPIFTRLGHIKFFWPVSCDGSQSTAEECWRKLTPTSHSLP